MRLFMSLDPPKKLQHQILKLCPVNKLTRILKADQIHLTLLFLGEQPDSIIPEISEALETLHFNSFAIELGDTGHFRSGVIWLGVKHNTALLNLQKNIAILLQQQGISFDHRRFCPHITLARSKRHLKARLLEQYHQVFHNQRFEFRAERLLLKSSLLTPKGASHRIEAEWTP